MASLNKVMLIGNLGRDPEIRYSQQGTAVVNFSLATSDQWTDKATGERQEKTEWHRIVVFGRQAETCEKYLSKGRSVYIEGKLQTRSWEKEGQTHYTTEIVAMLVQFLGGRQDAAPQGYGGGDRGNRFQGAPQGGGDDGYQRGPEPQPQPVGAGNFQSPVSAGAAVANDPISDDDIPF